MQEAQAARTELEQTILAAVQNFESRFPGCIVGSILAFHESPLDVRNGRTREVQVEVKL
jgi:hypothetical protein